MRMIGHRQIWAHFFNSTYSMYYRVLKFLGKLRIVYSRFLQQAQHLIPIKEAIWAGESV